MNTKVIEELVKLAGEEGTEVAHAAFKALRHGLRAEHPGTGESNLEKITNELGQVQAIIHLLIDYGVVSASEIHFAMQYKLRSINPYVYTFQVVENKVVPRVSDER